MTNDDLLLYEILTYGVNGARNDLCEPREMKWKLRRQALAGVGSYPAANEASPNWGDTYHTISWLGLIGLLGLSNPTDCVISLRCVAELVYGNPFILY